jgi:hypothetical protein
MVNDGRTGESARCRLPVDDRRKDQLAPPGSSPAQERTRSSTETLHLGHAGISNYTPSFPRMNEQNCHDAGI